MTSKQQQRVLTIFSGCEYDCENGVSPSHIEDKYKEEYDKEIGNIYQVIARLKNKGYVKKVDHAVYNLTQLGKNHLNEEENKESIDQFDQSRIEEIKKRSNSDNTYDWLTTNLCPHMIGNKKLRLASLCSALSLADGKKRNRVHLLIYGSADSGKTTILRNLDECFYGEYFPLDSGTGRVSGLRGTVKGNEIKNKGALIRNSGSALYVNELDKVNSKDVQRALGSTMEEGEIVFNMGQKENEVKNAHTRIIATCNNKNKVRDHILSRFDLKIKTEELEKNEKEEFAEESIMSWDRETSINRKLFRDYLKYAKKHEVKLPPREERRFIINTVREEISHGCLKDSSPRQILAVIRLSMALARLKLDDVVKKEHLKKALELVNYSD